MIGEIRDLETARIAIQAALTGHLVFSTLHTNTAIAAIARLIDIGLERYLLASTIAGIMAQRLVRKLCPACSRPHSYSDRLHGKLKMAQAGNPAIDLSHSRQPVGCEACGNTGYSGRTTISELLGHRRRHPRSDRTEEARISARSSSSRAKQAFTHSTKMAS